MVKVINILLLLLCVALGYFLVNGIVTPLKIKNKVEVRQTAVQDKLLQIRDYQEAFRTVNDVFAPNFDTLKTVLKTGEFKTYNRVTNDTMRVSLLDSLFKGDVSMINDLDKVPFSESKFAMDAGVLPSPTDSTLYVPVFEASTNTNEYLEGINKGFWTVDKKVKVGSMTAPITSGNWE